MRYSAHTKRGTTLIETLVAAAVFVVFSLAIYQLYAKVINLSSRIRTKTVATQIASEQIEFIRNLQYSDVGTTLGIPAGVVPQSKTITRNNVTFTIDTVIRNIDQVADGTLGGVPNDMSPADNKLASVTVTCSSCATPVSVEYTTAIAPKSLETENGNGALVIRVMDADGIPVPGATVTIENLSVSPAVSFSDTTDATGVLTIVDAPPSNQSYHITVSKTGFSTEQTYLPGSGGNTNPEKPHLTVAANTVTQATFAIDETSTIDLRLQSPSCVAITGVSGTLTGTKVIGTNPVIYKNILDFTANTSSTILSNIEWDNYTGLISGGAYDIAGTSPVFPLAVLPGSSQNVTLTLKPATVNSRLVVAVTDGAGLPIADATVEIVGPIGTVTQATSVGSITQTDWDGGAGQIEYVDTTKFFATDGGIDYTNVPGEITLATGVSSGTITSSTIDLGGASVFGQLTWFPSTQPSGIGATPVSFQIATNNDNLTWNFVGPDGTNATYYTSPVSDIASLHDNTQYMRYKLFFSTTDINKTPSITDIGFTYTTGCLPPGQTDFSGLTSGEYVITVSKTGYATTSKTITISSNTYEAIVITP